ncbi:hypothetical protein [Myxococcus virescens]|uniref:Uncharacterized protein n=1 Tax=Myxococcus virescens TaxID=83456 RepID=A0A511HNK8_9BACT|nr:hypothetical protein [Myxococcus virescens]GEL75170.1 hypothetical protein MVI01_69540 [Myxococcus virescens]SDD64391.1 hypothetical protein SAMN04488504_10295 [Myxococcus virescens]
MSERLPARFALEFEQVGDGWRASIPGYAAVCTGPFGYQEAHAAVLAEVARRHAAGHPSTTPDAMLLDAVGQVLTQRAKDDEWSTLNVSDAFRACLKRLRAAYDFAKGGGR